ncbi:MAG: CbiX/SirB N-terminal domain-containing protein, partial [Chlorobi bacterium]|nr:CbiX/SirB N-terminal domain-containing protein [Chlorobiota bacterium]
MGLLALICLTACDSGEHQSPNGKAVGDESRKTALLLINHGSRSGEWKRQLLELEQRVSSRIAAIEGIDTLATAFMEHAEPSIASSLRNLDRNGYTDVIVIPVFLSAGTHVFDDIPTIIGRKENPATIEEMKLEGIERYVPAARTHLAQPLDFSDLIGSHGRDAGYPAPPVQIRTCGTTAYGSCLESWRILPPGKAGIFG